MSRLQELVIELTDRCPMSCQHCSSNSGPACRESLAIETVRRILAEAEALQAKQISFGGGEPTVSSCFEEAVREAVGRGFSAEVFTCGASLFRNGRLVSLPACLLRHLASLRGRLTFVFSFHGSCSAIHDTITGVEGSFDCMTESLRRCKDLGIFCTANFVPTKQNASDLPNLASLLETLTIPKLSVLRFVPQGRGFSNRQRLELDRGEEDTFVEELADLRETTSIEIRTGSPFNGIIPDNNVPCRAGHQKLVIQANGNVLPCEVFKHHGRSDWGASIHSSHLDAIMGSPQFSALHKILLEGHCATCPVHGILRANQPHLGVLHGISEAAI
jgi:radical SAM protein with 4Fe4S-binding SPASM domain